MEREYSFSPELLRMILSEERQKFISALGYGASWKELNQIRSRINQINDLIDAAGDTKNTRTGPDQHFNERNSF